MKNLFENTPTYKGKIGIDFELPDNGIFVFGSNIQGRHGKGAALTAKQKYGAIYGQAKDLQGRSYAIVTKDLTKSVHPSISQLEIIEQIVYLYKFANFRQDLEFYVAYSGNGTNLNGYTPKEMADMFNFINYIPDNIIFEEEFYKLIYEDT